MRGPGHAGTQLLVHDVVLREENEQPGKEHRLGHGVSPCSGDPVGDEEAHPPGIVALQELIQQYDSDR